MERTEGGIFQLAGKKKSSRTRYDVWVTFIRQSVRDAWLHRTTTLRKARLQQQQQQRKLPVVMAALQADTALRESLGLASAPQPGNVHAWIVDTSIECDHERFSGFMKISLEELLLALRDDCHLLDDPEGLAEDLKTWYARMWRLLWSTVCREAGPLLETRSHPAPSSRK